MLVSNMLMYRTEELALNGGIRYDSSEISSLTRIIWLNHKKNLKYSLSAICSDYLCSNT
jgi:hypothetical protein